VFCHFEEDEDELAYRFCVSFHLDVPDAYSLPHAVFFNRGYNKNKEGEDEEKKLLWLGKKLETAMLKFIDDAMAKDALFVCAYELRHIPFLECLKRAINRGVKVKLIFDYKKSKGELKETALDANFALKETQFPEENLIRRTEGNSFISHNKFIVYCRGGEENPLRVWTGSANFTPSAIYGQLNCHSWINDEKMAKKYLGLIFDVVFVFFFFNFLRRLLENSVVESDDSQDARSGGKTDSSAVETGAERKLYLLFVPFFFNQKKKVQSADVFTATRCEFAQFSMHFGGKMQIGIFNRRIWD
jgi:hypothetical protein